MQQALRELADVSAAHDDAVQLQQSTLADMRERSLALLGRGASIEDVAGAAGLSTVALTAWAARTTGRPVRTIRD